MDILDMVDAPTLRIERGIIVGKTYVTGRYDVQRKDGTIARDVAGDLLEHSDTVKRKLYEIQQARADTSALNQMSDGIETALNDRGYEKEPAQ